MAKIFISYRRADSRAMTDNIHNYLANALGKENVFQDVEDIPLGVNFVTYLEETIGSVDVLLVIIGQRWLSITDTDGKRRLDTPNDPVRLEVASALRNDKLLVIPVLVDDAPMPDENALPDDLRELHFRNAARVRYNPDFERDMQDLIGKIGAQIKVTPRQRRSRLAWIAAVPVLVVMALLLVVGVFAAAGLLRTRDLPTPTAMPTVQPVEAGEYMVLVSQINPLSADTASRPVTRAIVTDLRQRLEQDIPFSTLRVREYGAPITSDEQAQRVAQETGAMVVIWGDYTAETVDLRVQVGRPEQFPDALNREILRRAADVRIALIDERTQSAAPQVLGIMTLVHLANSDGYQEINSLAILDLLKTTPTGTITSGGIAAHVHTGLMAFVSDSESALQAFDDALQMDTDALLYLLRSTTAQRLGLQDEALEDARTALSLAPDWVMPQYILSNHSLVLSDTPEAAVEPMTQVIERRPNDWFPLFIRSFAHFLIGDYDAAAADSGRVMALQPPSSVPYAIALALALREGRIGDVAAIQETVVRQFPNPTFFSRTLEALFGEETGYGHAVSAATYLALGQFRRVLEEVDAAIASGTVWAEIHFLQGLAHCNLDDLEAAESAYTRAIELDSTYFIVYLLRAQARLAQGNLIGGTQDLTFVQGQEWAQREEIQALIAAGLSQEITCQSFFS